MTRQEWAFAELDARRVEDAAFPAPPHPWSHEWAAYARQRRFRADRRKAMGYSRATADALAAWAAMQENRRAA